jgi:hypothetical protein
MQQFKIRSRKETDFSEFERSRRKLFIYDAILLIKSELVTI